MVFIKTLIHLYRGRLKFFVMAAFFLASVGLLDAASLFSFQPIIDLLIKPNELGQLPGAFLWLTGLIGISVSLTSAMIICVGFFVLRSIVSLVSTYLINRFHFRFMEETILDEFKSFFAARWQFFAERSSGTLGNTIIRETEKIGLTFEGSVQIFADSTRVMFYLGSALIVSWQLSLVVLTLVGVFLVPFSLLGRASYRTGNNHTSAANDFQGFILESLAASKIVLAFGKQRSLLGKLSEITRRYTSSALRFVMIRQLTPTAFEPFSTAIVLFAVYIGSIYFHLSISSLGILLYSFRMVSNLAIQVVNQKNQILNMAPALEQIHRLRNEAASLAQPSGSVIFSSLERGIVLNGVSYAYPNRKGILKDISLTFPKGKMVALVGKSGAGKTTIADIVMGLNEVVDGQFLVDGVDFRSLDVESWRSRIAYVPQEAFLFHTSIRENLCWSNESATDEEIAEACRLANATEFIDRLPEKWMTMVGERGVRLSGGQRQRIALARAILRKPEVLILDEATSALDSQSELLIQEAIENISKKTTIIAIAHRLSTIRRADYIYVLDEGRVVEKGGFDELLSAKQGQFLKSAELQGIRAPEILE